MMGIGAASSTAPAADTRLALICLTPVVPSAHVTRKTVPFHATVPMSIEGVPPVITNGVMTGADSGVVCAAAEPDAQTSRPRTIPKNFVAARA